MTRTVLVVALLMVPSFALAQENEGFLEDDDGSPRAFRSYCGGGGETSMVDRAFAEMQEGRLTQARELLVTALRSGGIETWQRGQALVTLAEIQLRLRQYGQAIVNYRKALRIDPHGVTATARVGLAVALHLRGAHAAARHEAITARDAVCSDRWSMEACYGAQAVLARTGRDAAERDQATRALSELRANHAELAASFDEVDRRLDRRADRGHEARS